MNTVHPHKRVLGVDGGGSKTIACIANVFASIGDGQVELEVIGRGESGPSNPRSVGFELALLNLSKAIGRAMSQSSVDPSSIDAGCLSLAGAGRPEEQIPVRQWADEHAIAKRTIVIDDVEPLRFAAKYEQSKVHSDPQVSWDRTVTLVVGTGAIACGNVGNGPSYRCGGWGYLLGDEGSGFSMGLAGLRSVCHSHDLGHELTDFQRELLAHLELTRPTDLIGFVYQSLLPRAVIAQLSEVVVNHADSDPNASRIVKIAIDAMVQLVEMTARRIELCQGAFALALSGGILCNHPSVVSQLLSELHEQKIAPQITHLVREPIYGPLLIAAQ